MTGPLCEVCGKPLGDKSGILIRGYGYIHGDDDPDCKPELVRGSGNVFADLDLPNPEMRQERARCATIVLKLAEMSNAEFRLRGGEMTDQEILTARAVLRMAFENIFDGSKP